MTRGRRNPLHLGFATRLQLARRQHNLAMSSLAVAAGLSKGGVQRLESTRRSPRLETVANLAEILGVAPGWLAFGLDPTSASPHPEGTNFGERIFLARKAVGLTQAALAAGAHVTGPAIYAWEKCGHLPDIATVEDLALVLGVDPAWLAFGELQP